MKTTIILFLLSIGLCFGQQTSYYGYEYKQLEVAHAKAIENCKKYFYKVEEKAVGAEMGILIAKYQQSIKEIDIYYMNKGNELNKKYHLSK